MPFETAGARPAPFRLLTALYADPGMSEVFSESATVRSWLRTELALARAEVAAGLLPEDDVAALERVCTLESIDLGELWAQARNVGYPVLGLVRQLAQQLPDGPDGHVHWGATTQDIMDTGLALQLGAAGDRMVVLLRELGDALAVLVDEHRGTVTAARTHAQQAVPTTFGAKVAVYLAQVTRDLQRVRRAAAEVRVVSLYGAGGTSAAVGPTATDVRRAMAGELGLDVHDVPWHVARDCVFAFGAALAAATGTAARLAREVIDLSRTEIGELGEAAGHHRGASSTMPQKANPISSEAVIGFSSYTGSLLPALHRTLEAGHERAAGEWQIEWLVLPEIACSAASAVRIAGEIARELRVFPAMMRSNLDADGGLAMAEAYMMRLAPAIGREKAHDLVYEAALLARLEGRPLAEVIGEDGTAATILQGPLRPEDYVGEVSRICDVALAEWSEATDAQEAGA